MDKPSGETYIHGFYVYYDPKDPIPQGIDHLRNDLQKPEVVPLFEYARKSSNASRGARFEDDHDRQFVILYNGDNTFTLVLRK